MCSYVCCDACQCQRPWHLTWFYQVLNKYTPFEIIVKWCKRSRAFRDINFDDRTVCRQHLHVWRKKQKRQTPYLRKWYGIYYVYNTIYLWRRLTHVPKTGYFFSAVSRIQQNPNFGRYFASKVVWTPKDNVIITVRHKSMSRTKHQYWSDKFNSFDSDRDSEFARGIKEEV